MRRALVLTFLLACGGKLATTSDAGSSSSSSSGSASSSSGGVDDDCKVAVEPGSRACVPPEARANTALSIDLDATEGCLPCFATLDPCNVEVRGSAITVGMTSRTCGSTHGRACPTICAIPATTCQLPPLSAGTYTVSVVGEGRNALRRELVVTDTATATSCELVRPPPSIGPFVLSKYSRACTQASDCAVVASLLCRPCACEDTAIARSALASFDADFRAASSQCAPEPTGACAPCEAVTAACVAGTCATR